MHALEDHGFCRSSSLKGPVFCCSICSASFSHVLALPSIQKITSRKFQSCVSGPLPGVLQEKMSVVKAEEVQRKGDAREVLPRTDSRLAGNMEP